MLLIVAGLIFFAWLVFYSAVLGEPFVITSLPSVIPTPVSITLFILMLIAHELLHGIGIQHFGHKVRYGFKWVVLYATTDSGYFWRNQMIIVALLPAVVLSILFLATTFILPTGLGIVIVLVAAANVGGAAGDVWMVWRALQYPPHAIVEDDADGMRVFMPQNHQH